MAKKKQDETKSIVLRAPSKDAPIANISTLAEFDRLITSIAKIGRQINKHELARDKKLAEIKEKYQKLIDLAKTQVNLIFEAVFRFANLNREQLLQPDRKSAEFTNGDIGWHTNPASVKLTVSENEAVDYFEKNGLGQYVRIIKEVDIESLRKNPSLANSLPICTYTEDMECFFVKPHGVVTTFMRRMTKLVAKITKPKRQ